MKSAGIICEYNPFHLGHLRQIRLVRETLGEETAILCVMSGNYVQRGMPAMWDKFTRAKAAVACGADLVLELPVTSVLQSAEGFARGGVEILTRMKTDVLSFGAECEDPSQLIALAHKIDTEDYTCRLREALDAGLPYAAARQQALGAADDIISLPNNILGLEYCRAILSLQSPLEPLIIHRTGSYHAAVPDAKAPSASSIRGIYPHGSWQSFVPAEAAPFYVNTPWYDLSFGERAVLARLRGMREDEWEVCAHGSEGLWSKAMKAARTQPDLEHIIDEVKSKRYPRTRIQRLLLCAYLGIRTQDLSRPISYVRILAANDMGRRLLRQARKEADLPLINPGQTPPDPEQYALEIRSSDLFTLFSAPSFPYPSFTEQSARLFGK